MECSDDFEDELLCINCGGKNFFTYYSTLAKLPGTPLSQIASQRERHDAYKPELKSYFFDRSPEAFSSVLDYYRSELVASATPSRLAFYWYQKVHT